MPDKTLDILIRTQADVSGARQAADAIKKAVDETGVLSTEIQRQVAAGRPGSVAAVEACERADVRLRAEATMEKLHLEEALAARRIELERQVASATSQERKEEPGDDEINRRPGGTRLLQNHAGARGADTVADVRSGDHDGFRADIEAVERSEDSAARRQAAGHESVAGLNWLQELGQRFNDDQKAQLESLKQLAARQGVTSAEIINTFRVLTGIQAGLYQQVVELRKSLERLHGQIQNTGRNLAG